MNDSANLAEPGFRFRGGRLCLDLTATVGKRGGPGVELLRSQGDLARWFGHIEGDLRPGGEFRASVDGERNGRVEACEAPRRLRITWRESDESFRKGRGVPPFDATVEATLTPEGNQTILVVEVAGMPLDKIAFYGAGWQIHAENLAVHIAGLEHGDVEARWDELVPIYQALAAKVG